MPIDNRRMNWKQILADLRMVMTLKDIAEQCGLSSTASVHDLSTGKQQTVSYEVGVRLLKLQEIHAKTIAAAKRAAKAVA